MSISLIPRQQQHSLYAAIGLLTLALLQGCGGGSDSTASTTDAPIAPAPSPAPAPTPTPAPSPVQPVATSGGSAAAWAAATSLGRGVNFGNMLEAPNEGDWDLRVTPAYIEAAWIAGFRTVRLPVRWSNHAASTAPYTLEPVFLRRVESVVDALLARGFQVVMDMHHHRQLDGDALDVGEFAVDEAVLHDRFATMWAQIAQRFSGRSNKLLFELYNEPHGRLTPALWNALANQALQKVRQSDPTRLVLVGPSPWYDASGLANLTVPDDRNLMVTVHNYAPFSFTHQGASWITPVQPTGVTCCTAEQQLAIQQPLAQAKAWSVTTGYPVVLGEFGAYSMADMGSRATYSRLVRTAAESHGMPWMVWDFAGGFGVYNPSTGLLRAELINALLGP